MIFPYFGYKMSSPVVPKQKLTKYCSYCFQHSH